ncbi:hypothetical protein LJC34_05825 [Oscillospiraceae bacterium OttesenSCG-928-G22]|nr:hypothetical protein [Oscillospiraceae bacterium OttesenSCG-928-G22]
MRRLTVNMFRYGKFVLAGLVLAAYPGYVLWDRLFSPDSADVAFSPALAGMAAIFAVGALLFLFGLLSLLVNRAEFGPDSIRYRTLLKRYTIPYSEILHVTERRQTVQTASPLPSAKVYYRVVIKSKNYDMSSLEFWGLGKEINKLKENGVVR